MHKRVNVSDFSIAAASALAGADGAPAWVKLLPMGTFTLRDGRGPFNTGDRANLQAIVDRSLAAAGNTELMIDYDHQSFFAVNPKVGGTAPAAGWIKQLEARDDGIWGRVNWTDAAAAAIKASEYRYISPLFGHSKTGDVDRLVNGALVNVPAIDWDAIAASFQTQTEEPSMKGIAKLLGLAETATEAEIIGAITGHREAIAASLGLGKDTAFASLATSAAAIVAGAGKVAASLGLTTGATTEQLVAAAAKLTTGQGDMVPKASFDQLQTQFTDFRTAVTKDKVAGIVAAAIEQGKVPPAQKEWAIAYATRDLADFEKYVASAPVLTGVQLGAKPGDAGVTEKSPTEIAAAARQYQAEQEKLGVVVSTVDAVAHVQAAKK